MRIMPIILLIALVLPSCFEEDSQVQPHVQGDLELGQASLGSDYAMQVWFDLERNMEVSSNVISEWDLSFESASGGYIIRLNSSKFMYAGNTRDTTFSMDISQADPEMRFDTSDGNPDSTAIGSWFVTTEDTAWSYREVYLLDRGLDERNREMGNKKVQFDIQGNDYVVRHANQDHSGDTTVVIGRDDNLDCIYYSFEKGVVDLAPLQDSWSLLFSRYTTMLQTDLGEDYPYLVTGVLLNPNGVAAALDTIHEFSEIEISDTLDLELTSRADVIGYEWKYYNFDAGLYTIVPEFNYVIRDRDGFYYKLRFIDFYNDTGEKGFPLFEYIRL